MPYNLIGEKVDIQDRFHEGIVITSQLIIPAIAIMLRAKDS